MPSYSHSVKYFNTFDSTFCSTNSAENQTVYSDCAALGVSCKVYYNTALTVPVTGYDFIKFGGVVHEMNFDTGEINPPTEVQCTIPDVKIYRISVPGGQTSYIEWTECEGWPGPKQLIYDRMRSIDVSAVQNSVSASSVATITEVGSCNPYPSCQCIYYGSTSTSTTTLPPVNFVLTPYCTGSGVNGNGTINVNTFSGGSGIYQSVAIGTTAGQAFSATPINLSGASSYEFTGLFNGTYYVILRDSIGGFKVNSTFVDCLNTTTTTSTTAAPICTYNGGSAVITYTTTTTTTGAPTTTSTSTSTSTTSTSTSTTTTSAPTTTTTTTAAPDITLFVYGKDTGANVPELQYRVNGGMWNNMGSLDSNCNFINSITGLSDGDNVEFQTDLANAIGSAGNTTVCPSAIPFACTTSYTITTGSPKFVAITADSSVGC